MCMDAVNIEVIFEFVGNLARESKFPLEARSEIEAVRRVKSSTSSLRQKGRRSEKGRSEKLTVRSRKWWWSLAVTFYWSEDT